MATAIEKEYSNIVCTLCIQELVKPKLLPCQHTFCTQCLIKHFEEGKPFSCPTCQLDIRLKDTIESIPDNYVFDIVKEADEGVLEQNLKCIPCSQGKKSTKATNKCLDCGDILCQHCNEWYCRLTVTRHHVTVPINDIRDGNSREEFIKRKVLYCTLHSTKEHKAPLSTYCNTCRCLVCLDCVQGDHNEHNFENIHSVREAHQMLFDKRFSNLQRSSRDQDKRRGNIETVITDTKRKWSQQETEIHNTATEIHAIVDTAKNKKLTELNVHYEKELQFLNHLLEEERNRQSRLWGTVAFTKTFLEKSSDSDFLFHEDDIETRINTNQIELSKNFKRNVVSIEKKGTETIDAALKDVLGRIETREKVVPHKCRIGPVMVGFRTDLRVRSIYGLAFNTNGSNEILVSGSWDYEGILVLNEDGNYDRIIQCENANDSHDVHLTKSNLFLTIDSEEASRVVVMDLNGEVIKSVMLPEDDRADENGLGIVVDSGNTTYVSSNLTNRIYRLQPDEDELSVFISSETGKYIDGPIYPSLTPDGELVVSNKTTCTIQVFSKDGESLWQYDGNEEGNEMDHPSGVCCDEDGYIYVVDRWNHRIQVIRDRKWVGNIPISKEAKGYFYVPLIVTPKGELIYGYGNHLVKIAFWE